MGYFWNRSFKTIRMPMCLTLILACALFLSFCSTTGPKVVEKPQEELQSPLPSVPILPDVYIEVNIPATEMTVYENGKPKFVKPVAIGQGIYPTPEQETSIKRIEWNPWWYPPDSGWARGAKPTPPGTGNPLGLVKMPLSREILFHGTNKASSIGQPASHGCMRMHNADATEVAWYLQTLFSSKNDPSLKQTYKKNGKTTFAIALDVPVQVKIVYKPVVVRNNSLHLYPDYYNKLGTKKKAAILMELVKSGISLECIDDQKVDNAIKQWSKQKTEIALESLKIDVHSNLATRGPVCE